MDGDILILMDIIINKLTVQLKKQKNQRNHV